MLGDRDARHQGKARVDDIPGTDDEPQPCLHHRVAGMEAVRVHTGMGRKEARDIAVDYLSKVGIPAARQRMSEYPHQLSGV